MTIKKFTIFNLISSVIAGFLMATWLFYTLGTSNILIFASIVLGEKRGLPNLQDNLFGLIILICFAFICEILTVVFYRRYVVSISKSKTLWLVFNMLLPLLATVVIFFFLAIGELIQNG